MTSDSRWGRSYARRIEESDLSLAVVILFLLGVFGLLFGLLLFRIDTGDLPYNPDSTYGLFLVLVSFQVITFGKTPSGDLRRPWALIIIGNCTALSGMASCFIPGYLPGPVHVLVGVVLFTGGIVLLIQLCVSGEKARRWVKISGTLGDGYFLDIYPHVSRCFQALLLQCQGLEILKGVGLSPRFHAGDAGSNLKQDKNSENPWSLPSQGHNVDGDLLVTQRKRLTV